MSGESKTSSGKRRRAWYVAGLLVVLGAVTAGGIALMLERRATAGPDGSEDRRLAQLSPYCRLAHELGEASPTLQLLATGDADRIRTRLREWTRLTRAARAESPPEIRADIDTLAAGTLDFARLLEKHDYDLEAMAEDPVVARLESPRRERRLAAAQERVGEYNREHCRLDDREDA